jgi:hypothetical protein
MEIYLQKLSLGPGPYIMQLIVIQWANGSSPAFLANRGQKAVVVRHLPRLLVDFRPKAFAEGGAAGAA